MLDALVFMMPHSYRAGPALARKVLWLPWRLDFEHASLCAWAASWRFEGSNCKITTMIMIPTRRGWIIKKLYQLPAEPQ